MMVEVYILKKYSTYFDKKKLSILQWKPNANNRSIDYYIDSRLTDIIFSGVIGIAYYVNPIATKFSTHYIIYNPELALWLRYLIYIIL